LDGLEITLTRISISGLIIVLKSARKPVSILFMSRTCSELVGGKVWSMGVFDVAWAKVCVWVGCCLSELFLDGWLPCTFKVIYPGFFYGGCYFVNNNSLK